MTKMETKKNTFWETDVNGQVKINQHKLIDMVNVKICRCIYYNCMIRASCNMSNEKIPLYCNQHKLNDMISIIKHHQY